MGKIQKAISLLKTNRGEFMASILSNFFLWLPDDIYLKLLFRFKMGHKLNLKNPRTFNEKLQWLKLYNRNPEYTIMVDKYAVKQYVANIIGEEYIIPTLGVWDKFDDIDFSTLPDQFVLKTTHGGGGCGVVICRDKHAFDKDAAKRRLEATMKSDIYKYLREWPYKNVPKRIIAEKYMAPEIGISDLLDYKFFCFNGKAKFFKVDFGRFIEHHANYYDTAGNLLPFGEKKFEPDPYYPIELPNNFRDMMSLAERLSKNEPFLRVDFYNVNGKIFFGELTFYPASGLGKWTSDEADKEIGEYIKL